LLRSNTNGYGSKTRWTDSQNSDKTAPSGRELNHLQFSLQAMVRKLLDTSSYFTAASVFYKGLGTELSTIRTQGKHSRPTLLNIIPFII